MSQPTENQLTQFMRMLQCLGMEKQEILQITTLLGTTENLTEVVDRLEEKAFTVTAQEAMDICAAVIQEHQK